MHTHEADQMEELLAKTLAGEASAEERALVEKWLAADASRQKAFEQAKKIFETSEKLEAPGKDVDAAWDKVREMMRSRKVVPLHPKRTIVFRAAAAIVLVLGAASLIYFITREGGPAAQPVVVDLKAGEKILNDTLPDGSRITLNANTRLKSLDDFNGRERRVQLDGEASFDVTHMPQRPFIIQTNSAATVRVLGTSFNVRAEKEGDVEVLVSSGRVSLRAGNDSLILLPGEIGRFSSSSGKLEKKESIDPNYDAWKTHRLIFKDTELEQVVEILSKFYRRDVRIDAEQIGELRLTATFENESLDRVLEVIGATLNLRVVKDENGLRLEK